MRVAITLSTLLRIPIRIIQIRGGRSKPGLMEQHLKGNYTLSYINFSYVIYSSIILGIELVRDICSAKTKGVSIGSTEIEFWPRDIKGGSYKAAVKTAGSISLLLQVALPCILFADSPTKLILQGGTNAEMAPQIDYTTEVFRPIMEKFGATFDLDLLRRGYFPRGGGEVIVNVNSIQKLNPINMTERGNILKIYGWSFVAGSLPERLSHQMTDAATNILRKYGTVNIESYKEDRNIAPDSCSGIM